MINAPNSTMVVVEWLNTVPALTADGVAAVSSLPVLLGNEDQYAAGFVLVTVIGGDREPYDRISHPVVQIDVYALKNGSPLWTRGQKIVAAIKRASDADNWQSISRVLSLSVRGVSFGTASVLECGGMVNTEERQLFGDVGQSAHWQFDMDFAWAVMTDA